MKALRVFLALVGIAAIAVAIAYPFRDVETASGRSCGSAWSQVRAELNKNNKSFGGVVVDPATACKESKETVLKRSIAIAGGGVVLLVVVAAWPTRKWRSPVVVAAGGG